MGASGGGDPDGDELDDDMYDEEDAKLAIK
jgi:hypothetical protein